MNENRQDEDQRHEEHAVPEGARLLQQRPVRLHLPRNSYTSLIERRRIVLSSRRACTESWHRA